MTLDEDPQVRADRPTGRGRAVGPATGSPGSEVSRVVRALAEIDQLFVVPPRGPEAPEDMPEDVAARLQLLVAQWALQRTAGTEHQPEAQRGRHEA